MHRNPYIYFPLPNSGKSEGFTLIELLVVLSIMGILIGLTLFSIGGARESSRDAKRKVDLETIASALEVYKADCNRYPTGSGNPPTGEGNPASVLATSGESLTGYQLTGSCLTTNVYLAKIPQDPREPNSVYRYWSNGTGYQICAYLEHGTQGADGIVYCNTSSDCVKPCNYKVTNP